MNIELEKNNSNVVDGYQCTKSFNFFVKDPKVKIYTSNTKRSSGDDSSAGSDSAHATVAIPTTTNSNSARNTLVCDSSSSSSQGAAVHSPPNVDANACGPLGKNSTSVQTRKVGQHHLSHWFLKKETDNSNVSKKQKKAQTSNKGITKKRKNTSEPIKQNLRDGVSRQVVVVVDKHGDTVSPSNAIAMEYRHGHQQTSPISPPINVSPAYPYGNGYSQNVISTCPQQNEHNNVAQPHHYQQQPVQAQKQLSGYHHYNEGVTNNNIHLQSNGLYHNTVNVMPPNMGNISPYTQANHHQTNPIRQCPQQQYSSYPVQPVVVHNHYHHVEPTIVVGSNNFTESPSRHFHNHQHEYQQAQFSKSVNMPSLYSNTISESPQTYYQPSSYGVSGRRVWDSLSADHSNTSPSSNSNPQKHFSTNEPCYKSGMNNSVVLNRVGNPTASSMLMNVGLSEIRQTSIDNLPSLKSMLSTPPDNYGPLSKPNQSPCLLPSLSCLLHSKPEQ